jgi:predicted transposase/invertase (TIGR01784 family)
MNDKKTLLRKDKTKKRIQIGSDGLFKSIMEDKIAAREFLEEYLPANLQLMLDLNKITVEKESYIEDDLKKKFSDVVYSVGIKRNGQERKGQERNGQERKIDQDDKQERQEHEKAFVYVLLEHQSKPDYWMALRLWKYTLLLCERHKQKQQKHDKLPLIAPIVFYNGKEKYTSPQSLWQLFDNPDMARQLLGDEFKLVDLQAKTDDEIKRTQHIGLMEFFMKHIHERDMLKLWERFMNEYSSAVLLDKENGYIYIKKLLWYTNTKVAEEDKGKLNQLIIDSLTNKDGEDIMRTIADSYRDQYYGIGMQEGMQEGIEKGIQEGIEQTAIKMIKQNLDLKLISSVTGLTSDEILKLKNNS